MKSCQGKFLYGSFVWYNFREKALYCYENESTGEIKWEYPKDETAEQTLNDNVALADDAMDMDMDISTTPPPPPPNEHESLPTAINQTNGKIIPHHSS